MTKEKKYLFFFLAVFLLFVGVEFFSPQQIDWKQSFSRKDKIPFGTYVLYDVLPNIFPGKKCYENKESFYDYLSFQENPKNNLLIINKDFMPDELDLEVLLDYVYDGNHAFIAAEEFGQNFSDSVGISTATGFSHAFNNNDSASLILINAGLKPMGKFWFKAGVASAYFDHYDSLRTTPLGQTSHGKTNFIAVRYGKGKFLLHTAPL
ncbi:MAG: DUF4350 domain-containing protein, partial [Bacteroidetes bacterium]|nr:DUF4350 domain-containing protein [Bacteroidota bacterium]